MASLRSHSTELGYGLGAGGCEVLATSMALLFLSLCSG